MIERRYGIARTVWLVGPWAIKTPRFKGALSPVGRVGIAWTIPRAWLANLSEKDWSGAEGIAPVLHSWFGGLVNVYPRCEPWPYEEEPDYLNIGSGWIPRDKKPENVGLLNGEPVWLDYDGSWNGCPHSRNVANLSWIEEVEDC